MTSQWTSEFFPASQELTGEENTETRLYRKKIPEDGHGPSTQQLKNDVTSLVRHHFFEQSPSSGIGSQWQPNPIWIHLQCFEQWHGYLQLCATLPQVWRTEKKETSRNHLVSKETTLITSSSDFCFGPSFIVCLFCCLAKNQITVKSPICTGTSHKKGVSIL